MIVSSQATAALHRLSGTDGGGSDDSTASSGGTATAAGNPTARWVARLLIHVIARFAWDSLQLAS